MQQASSNLNVNIQEIQDQFSKNQKRSIKSNVNFKGIDKDDKALKMKPMKNKSNQQ